MNSRNLHNLANVGQLKAEPYNQVEFNGLINSGKHA
jgi:hypothetical protein